MNKIAGVKHIGKNISIYGNNAMHYAVEIYTKKYGYICFRPTTGHGHWKWYFYVSPNGTPWASTFAIGPGLRTEDKVLAPVRKAQLGHNFDTDILGDKLSAINNA